MQQVPTEQYNQVMTQLAADFQNMIKKSLAEPYPYAPGFANNRPKKGIRDMKKQTGSLYNSIKVSFNPQTNQIKVMMLDYWKYVNDGRKPGSYVPIKPLMAWIRAKGLNKNKQTGKFEKFSIKGTAFAISKSIQKFGIARTNFYDDAFGEFVEKFEDDAVKALGIDIANFLNNIIEEDITK